MQIEGVLLVVRQRGRILLRQNARGPARRMAGFWDLPAPEDLPGARAGRQLGEFRHTITHHHYRWTVYEAALGGKATAAPFHWFQAPELAAIPLTTTARKGLKLAGFCKVLYRVPELLKSRKTLRIRVFPISHRVDFDYGEATEAGGGQDGSDHGGHPVLDLGA